MCNQCDNYVPDPMVGMVVYDYCEGCGMKDWVKLGEHPEIGLMGFCIDNGPNSIHASRMEAKI